MSQKTLKKPKKPRFSERQQNIFNFLKNNPVAVLSTATKQGHPHGTVIYFYISPSFEIFFITKDHTHKYKNILQNNTVMLIVFDAKSQTVCQIEGGTSRVASKSDFNEIFTQIVKKSMQKSIAGELPISKINAGDYIALKIHPDTIKFSVFARPRPLNNDELFESIGWYELSSSNLP